MTLTTRFSVLASLIFAPAAWAADDDAVSALVKWQDDASVVFEASEATLDEFQWLARPVVVFADTAADPRFQQQIDLLKSNPDELAMRDVVIIVDTDPAASSDLRTRLRPRGFMLAVLAKDGTVTLRKPFPWDVRELTRAIDKLPLRRDEIRAGG